MLTFLGAGMDARHDRGWRVGDSSLAQQGPLGQASRLGPQAGAAGQFHVYNPDWSLGR
jgi:hypothetical protein